MPEFLQQASLQWCGWLVWPIVLCVLVLLVQLVFLLYSVLDCMTLIRYELLPALKDVRLTASHMEDLSATMVNSTQLLGQGLKSGRSGLSALYVGLKRAFVKSPN
jgi:Flp pilus assembly protein TadB